MSRNQACHNSSTKYPHMILRKPTFAGQVSAGQTWLRLGVVMLCLLGSMGCNSFGNGKLVKELERENERLLAEFRAQRDRNAELEASNRLQAERLAESEKLLARLTQETPGGRLSSLPTYPNQVDRGRASGAGNAGLPYESTANGTPVGPFADSPNAAGLKWQPRQGYSQ